MFQGAITENIDKSRLIRAHELLLARLQQLFGVQFGARFINQIFISLTRLKKGGVNKIFLRFSRQKWYLAQDVVEQTLQMRFLHRNKLRIWCDLGSVFIYDVIYDNLWCDLWSVFLFMMWFMICFLFMMWFMIYIHMICISHPEKLVCLSVYDINQVLSIFLFVRQFNALQLLPRTRTENLNQNVFISAYTHILY